MKLITTALFTILSLSVFSQSNYQPGVVVKANGDTLKGFIDYREWALCPKSISFRANNDDSKSLQFDAGNIKMFKILGLDTYVSYSGLVSMDKNVFPELPSGLDTSKTRANIFLKQLATGPHITLFYQNDETKTRYFIAEKDHDPIELSYHQYYDDQREIIEKKLYKGQLLFYLNKFDPNNIALQEKINIASFNNESLISVVNGINGVGSTVSKSTGGIRLFAGAGLFFSNNRYSFKHFVIQTETGRLYTDVETTSSSQSPQINAGIDMFINPATQRMIFRTEVSLSTLNAKITYPISGLETPASDNLSFKQNNLSIEPQFIYNIYDKKNFKAYVDAGASINLSSYSDISFTSTTTGQADLKSQNSFEFSNFWLSFPFEAGVTIYNKLDLGIIYIPYAKITPHTDSFVGAQLTGFGVKYLFGK